MYKHRGFLLSCGSESLAMHGQTVSWSFISPRFIHSYRHVLYHRSVLLSGTLAFFHMAGRYRNSMGTFIVVYSPTHIFLSDSREKKGENKGQIPWIRVFSSNSALHVSLEKLEKDFLSYTVPFSPHL